MKVTIDEVAKQAGVSKATVSRILNGNYGQTTEQTKDRVLRIIRELDYRPNPHARALKQMKTNVIGIVLSNLKNSFWTRVLEGVEDSCRISGYSLMICNSNEDPKLELELIRGLIMRQVDGILVNPTVKNGLYFEELISERYPLVFINRKITGIEADSVVVDNIKGARLATDHFIGIGKKKIVMFVYVPDGISTWQERVDGYRETMRHSGLEPVVIEVPNRAGAAKISALEYLRLSPDAEAVFSTNNMMTLEILEAVKELKLEIPRDIGIIGYDETVWAQHLHPPLTTVKQPAYEMGVLAAKNVMKRITAKTKLRPKFIVLEPELIVRNSCGMG
ncbi:MAG: transcriptional regulator [Paenibacillus sp.]|jgi:DNA-binding LacI/PurR family transcriptional regulator|nr:transcriptional regulator [Paenibacillus sp.]